MSPNDHDNGNGAAHGNGAAATEQAAPHLVIQVADPLLFTLQIGGQFPSLDYALNMLDQARRELEAQWRLQRAAQYQQQQINVAYNEQIRRELQKGR